MPVPLHRGSEEIFHNRGLHLCKASNLENYSASIPTNRCRHSIDVILGSATSVIQYLCRRAMTQACGSVIVSRVLDIEMLLRSLLGLRCDQPRANSNTSHDHIRYNFGSSLMT
jgi:hypothetical protein